MKMQSIVLASMLAFVGTATFYNTAFADTATKVTATCKDGTAFSGDTKKGACSGHKGVKEWGNATPTATPVETPAAVTPAAPAPSAPSAAATKPAATPAKAAAATPTAPALGGGAGKVWVNGDSKVYHCQGTKWYGTTKTGSYMSEAEAKAAGNHPDHGKVCS